MTPDQVDHAQSRAGWYGRRYARMYRMEPSDVIQAGLLGLLSAAHRFDPARSGWRTFADVYILAAIRRYCAYHARVVKIPEHERQQARNEGRHIPPDSVSMDETDEEGKPYMLHIGAVDGIAELERRDIHRRLHAALNRLDEEGRAIIDVQFFDGRTQAEITGTHGRTRSIVQLKTKQAMSQLRDYMGANHAR